MTTTPTDAFDMWDDKCKPTINYNATVYYVNIPRESIPADLPHQLRHIYAYVDVDITGVVTISNYGWFGKYSSAGIQWEVTNEILSWLQEWELVERRPLGPEDYEWFATDKLRGEADFYRGPQTD